MDFRDNRQLCQVNALSLKSTIYARLTKISHSRYVRLNMRDETSLGCKSISESDRI